MIGPATTTVSILRGTAENADGDLVDNPTAVVTGVTASIRELTRLNRTEASQRSQTVRSFLIRVALRTGVQPADRIKDERTGLIYLVDWVQAPLSFWARGWADLRIGATLTD